jgi:hypothetical protein
MLLSEERLKDKALHVNDSSLCQLLYVPAKTSLKACELWQLFSILDVSMCIIKRLYETVVIVIIKYSRTWLYHHERD